MHEHTQKTIPGIITPQTCPQCAATTVAKIIYGLPQFNDDLYNQMIHGRIVLGGMKPPANAPAWMCLNCEAGLENSPAEKQFAQHASD